MVYYTVYYLREDDGISSAASINFSTTCAAYQHAAEALESNHGVEVWKDGAQVILLRRERTSAHAA